MRKIVTITAFLLLLVSCKQKEQVELKYAYGNAFGSTYGIQYYSDKNLNEEIENALKLFDESISTYNENSVLSRFNASEKGMPMDSINLDLWKKCHEYYQKSHGFFDPTVEPLSALYGFKTSHIQHSPSVSQVDSVLAFVGMDKTYIQQDSIVKKDARTQLVFNAITGYINDYIAHLLDENQVESYLVEIGGEIRAKGKKENGNYWVVGVDVPKENDTEQELFTSLELHNESLATSGNYRKFYVLESGEKIVHTMNPKTGKTGTSPLLSATVVAPTCAEADAMATALMAMGKDEAQKFVKETTDLKFLLIWSDENGEYQSQAYNGFGESSAQK